MRRILLVFVFLSLMVLLIIPQAHSQDADGILRVVASPDETLLAVAGTNGLLKIVDAEWVYAVIQSPTPTTSLLAFYDPYQNFETVVRSPLELSPNLYAVSFTSRAFLSPDRNWFGTILYGQSSDIFRLYNVHTPEYRDLASGLFPDQRESQGLIQTLLADWTSDSSAIGLSYDIPGPGFQVARHLLRTGSTEVRLTTSNNYIEPHIAWRPNTMPLQFASERVECDASDTCKVFLSLIDSESGTILMNKSLAELQFAGPICGLSWSPNGTYLAFLSACPDLAVSIPGDIFLWRPQTNTITQVTNFTYPYFGTPGVLTPDFSLFWFDADTLVIGTTNARLQTAFNQTLVYHPSTSISSVLSNLMTRSWARNPVTGQLAYRAFRTSGFDPVNPVIHLSTFANDTLTVNRTLPNGCDLAWSPDGATLAHTLRGVGNTDCANRVTALVFYDVAAQTTRQIDFSASESVLPVGWVARPTGNLVD